jgi:hypothetical protein
MPSLAEVAKEEERRRVEASRPLPPTPRRAQGGPSGWRRLSDDDDGDLPDLSPDRPKNKVRSREPVMQAGRGVESIT